MNDIALLHSASIAHAIAHAILEGFDKHYRIFREAAQQAKRQFEHAEWQAITQAARDRIDYYDKRVLEAAERVAHQFNTPDLEDQVWRVINGIQYYPFLIPILHDAQGKLCLDSILIDTRQLDIFFSTNRAYFLVDMEVPSAYVTFLRTLSRNKPKWEIYTIVGLQKHG